MRCIFWFVGAVLLAAQGALAQGPAVQLKPLAGGPLTVGIVCPAAASLDVQALAERVDVQLQTVFLQGRGAEGDGDKSAAALDALLAKKPPRVVVLANVDLDTLPSVFTARLRAFVEAGGGLAMAYCTVPEEGPWRELVQALEAPEELPHVARGVPVAYAPDGTALADAAKAATLGSGRVVTFDFAGDLPRYHALYPPAAPGISPDLHHVEHACLLWARVLLWLSRREAGQHLISVANVSPDGPNDTETPPDLPEAFVQSMRDTVVAQLVRPFAIALNEPAEADYQLDVQVRPVFQQGPGYHTNNVLPKGAPLIVPQLLCGAGAFYVDAVMMRKKEVVDFFSTQVAIENWPEFESLRADRTYLQANDTLTIEAQVRSVYSQHRSATIYAQALDSHGRLVAQAWQPVSHSGGRVLLTLSFADLIAPLVEVRVMGLEGPPRMVTPWDIYAAQVDTMRFPVRFSRTEGAINWAVVMPSLAEENAAEYLERMADLGVTHVAAPGGRPALVTSARIPVMLAPLMVDPLDASARGGMDLLHDAAFARREDERLREEILDYLAGGSGAYVLSSPALAARDRQIAPENTLTLEAFRDWATARGERMPNDDEALVATIIPTATDSGAPGAAYGAFQTFLEESHAAFLGARRETLQKIDRAATAGIVVPAGSNWHGSDWHLLAGQVDFVAAEWDAVSWLKLASYGRGAPLSGMQTGAGWSEAGLALAPWLAAISGQRAVWSTSPLEAGSAILAPDGTPTASGAALAAAMDQCNGTLGALLRDARAAPAVVGILDAPASREPSPEAREAWHASQESLARALARAGHWPEFVHVNDLAGAWDAGLRALAWTAGTVLGDHETQQLGAFVAQGGVVIAAEADCGAASEALGEGNVSCGELAAVLTEKEIAPPLPLDAGAWAKGGGTDVLVRRFAYGQATIVLGVPWPGQKTKKSRGVPLEFPKEGQVFRPLQTTRKGVGGRRADLRGTAPDCAVHLPYKVEDFDLQAPETVVSGSRLELLCQLTTDSLNPGRHLIEITLSPPHGKPIAGGRRWVPCDSGRARSYISVPLNAIPGDYVLRGRDLLTGMESQTMVEVLNLAGPGFHALH
jgi:hypothetical protein